MKILGLLMLLVLFMGLSSITPKKSFQIRPNQEEIVRRKELKLELTKSEVEVKIAEIKFEKNID